MALSGQITIATAGVAVAGPATEPSVYQLQANPANTGNCFVGNDGSNDVTSANGFTLIKNGTPIRIKVLSLEMLYFDAANNGDKVDWLLVA